MSDKISKILKWKPSEKLVAALAVCALAMILVPLLRLCMYSVPWWDDYGYANYVKAGFDDTCTLWKAIKGGIAAAVDEWHSWQGTYSAIFGAALVPLIWGDKMYGWGPAYLIVFLTVSVLVFVWTFIRNILKGDAWNTVILQAGCAAMIVMFIYSAQQGLYWYDGGAIYVAPYSLSLLFFSAMMKLWKAEKKSAVAAWMIVCVVLAFLVGGGSYVTTLQSLLVVCSVLALSIWQRRDLIWRFVPVTAMSLIGFLLNVLAPGNSCRGEYYVGWGMGPVEAVFNSFVEGVKRFPELTGLRTLPVLILLAPFMWQIVKKTEFKFRYPLLILLWSFCLYAATFTPGLYALGSVVLDRMLCVIKFTLQLALLLNEMYLLGWFCQKRRAAGKAEHEGKACWWFYPVIGACMLLIFAGESNQAGNYSAYGAYYYIHTGEANNFYQEYQERVALLQSDEPNIVFEPYQWRPWFLCAGELSDNPNDHQNVVVANWYKKQSVICKEKESE